MSLRRRDQRRSLWPRYRLGTTIPRLDTAGLKLVGLVIDPGNIPLFTASYRGPHGCRLELRARPVGTIAPAHRRQQPAQLGQWATSSMNS